MAFIGLWNSARAGNCFISAVVQLLKAGNFLPSLLRVGCDAMAVPDSTFLGSFVELLDMMDMASKLGFDSVNPIRLRRFLAAWSCDAYPTERYGDPRELFADLIGEMAAIFGAKDLLQVSHAASGPCVACHRHGKTKPLDERIMQLSLFAVEHALSSGAPFEDIMMECWVGCECSWPGCQGYCRPEVNELPRVIALTLEGGHSGHDIEINSMVVDSIPEVLSGSDLCVGSQASYNLIGAILHRGVHYLSVVRSSPPAQRHGSYFELNDEDIRFQGGWGEVQHWCCEERYTPRVLLYEEVPSTAGCRQLRVRQALQPQQPRSSPAMKRGNPDRLPQSCSAQASAEWERHDSAAAMGLPLQAAPSPGTSCYTSTPMRPQVAGCAGSMSHMDIDRAAPQQPSTAAQTLHGFDELGLQQAIAAGMMSRSAPNRSSTSTITAEPAVTRFSTDPICDSSPWVEVTRVRYIVVWADEDLDMQSC